MPKNKIKKDLKQEIRLGDSKKKKEKTKIPEVIEKKELDNIVSIEDKNKKNLKWLMISLTLGVLFICLIVVVIVVWALVQKGKYNLVALPVNNVVENEVIETDIPLDSTSTSLLLSGFEINHYPEKILLSGIDLFDTIDVQDWEVFGLENNQGITIPVDYDNGATYYSVGNIVSNQYKDYEIVLGFRDSAGADEGKVLFVIFLKGLDENIVINNSQGYFQGLEITKALKQEYKEKVIIDTSLLDFYNSEYFMEDNYVGFRLGYVVSYSNLYDIQDTKVLEQYKKIQVNDLCNENEAELCEDIFIYYDGPKYKNIILTPTDLGFYKQSYLIPEMFINSSEYGSIYFPEDISWSSGEKEKIFNYVYSTPSACGGGIDYLDDNFNINEFEVVGVFANGDPIYEPLDKINNEYLKKFYNEDYLEYSEIFNEGEPYTYEEFITKHPVIYWIDGYGRMARFHNQNFAFVGGCAKPAIYLYPERPMDITVSLKTSGKITFTNPEMDANNIWTDIFVTPEGKILKDEKFFDYLWWESTSQPVNIKNSGFIVERDTLERDIRKKLEQAGLNIKESDQFVAYWLPKMYELDTDKFYITFIFNEEVDQIANLEIEPNPDNVYRIFMFYRPFHEEDLSIREGLIKEANRQGFYVVEWGGGLIP